jgi:hypothetical protein
MRNFKIMKVPIEFYNFIEDTRFNLEQNTGEDYTKAKVMRKMGNKLKGRLVVRGNEFDWKIF